MSFEASGRRMCFRVLDIFNPTGGSELFPKIARLCEGRWELCNQGSVLGVCVWSHPARLIFMNVLWEERQIYPRWERALELSLVVRFFIFKWCFSLIFHNVHWSFQPYLKSLDRRKINGCFPASGKVFFFFLHTWSESSDAIQHLKLLFDLSVQFYLRSKGDTKKVGYLLRREALPPLDNNSFN